MSGVGGVGAGDVDVESGIDRNIGAGGVVEGAFDFACDVVGGEAGGGDLVVRGFLVVKHLVDHLEDVRTWEIAENGLADAVDEGDDAAAADAVVEYRLDEIGILSHIGKVAFRAVKGAKGAVMPDVEANGCLGIGGLGAVADVDH